MATEAKSTVLGVVILVRHGDRRGFFQNPVTYAASHTAITPLGNRESRRLGRQLRNIYLNPLSPDVISSINPHHVRNAQVQIRADVGGEGGVIFHSAVSVIQELFPSQIIPIDLVNPENDISLESWIDCHAFAIATRAFYRSDLFKETAAAHAGFLKSLRPFLDGRPATLVDMWNIFDFLNVQTIHNETFAKALPAGFLKQARDLANFHEHGVFTSPKPNGIGNIAGQTILPSILDGFSKITDPTSPRKFILEAISYKPFLSLFNLTGVTQINPKLAGIVDYSAAVAFEVRQPRGGGEPVLRFKFKNGTHDEFTTIGFLGSTSDVPVSQFVNTLTPLAFDDIPTWCRVCDNHHDRRCRDISASSDPAAILVHQDRVSPIGFGSIGTCITPVHMFGVLALLSFLGLLVFRRNKSSNGHVVNADPIWQKK